uniref:Chitinase domain-containing protein 2 n=1 Tax=Chilo infuscatellus TaxID=236790 RepID=A0A5J6DQS9_9NEOP|nr:chitinase domain-containing protein 2 [Chilo infuscatellus]
MGAALGAQTLGGPMHDKVVICYVASWAANRPDGGNFLIEDLEPALCTHLVYSYAGLDEKNMTIKSLNPWLDMGRDNNGYRKLVSLKTHYPHLKVTIAVGGWDEGSEKYSKMASSRENREKFIMSVIAFLDEYKFDGLDLDWMYPAFRGGVTKDKVNFVKLIKELSEAFKPQGYILTAALSASQYTMDHAYDLPKLNRYLTYIHMQSYDYHGTWDAVVGPNAPLKGDNEYDFRSVDFTINYMLSHGVSPNKLVLGLPMYGRTFILKEPNIQDIIFGLNSVQSSGFKGPYTNEKGYMGYNEICQELSNKSSTWTRFWHSQSSTPYLRDGERVICYDNSRSLAIKVKTAIDYGLGGFMVSNIDTDDFKGVCEHETDAFIDFEQRYAKMVDDPALNEALKYLDLPDTNRLTKGFGYSVSNGRLNLRIPEPQYTKYPLMKTINTAAILAIEEKRILDEMKVTHKTNVIEEEKEQEENKPNTSHRVTAGVAVLFSALTLFTF